MDVSGLIWTIIFLCIFAGAILLIIYKCKQESDRQAIINNILCKHSEKFKAIKNVKFSEYQYKSLPCIYRRVPTAAALKINEAKKVLFNVLQENAVCRESIEIYDKRINLVESVERLSCFNDSDVVPELSDKNNLSIQTLRFSEEQAIKNFKILYTRKPGNIRVLLVTGYGKKTKAERYDFYFDYWREIYENGYKQPVRLKVVSGIHKNGCKQPAKSKEKSTNINITNNINVITKQSKPKAGISVMTSCSKCGEVNSDNLKVCPCCGASLISGNTVELRDEHDDISLLKEYNDLREAGIITEEEFQRKKSELLH